MVSLAAGTYFKARGTKFKRKQKMTHMRYAIMLLNEIFAFDSNNGVVSVDLAALAQL